MLLFEQHAALLLTAHAIFAFLTVALSTHLALWLRQYWKGKFGKRRSINRFALLSAGAYAITMLLGLALYPSYKVRVRAEYLENPSRLHRSAEQEVQARLRAQDQDKRSRDFRRGLSGELVGEGDPARDNSSEPHGADWAGLADAKVERGEKLARWFDVKEHWAALGLLLSFALCGILLSWKPDANSKGIAKPLTAMAWTAALMAWAAAIIGLVTAAAHSVVAL